MNPSNRRCECHRALVRNGRGSTYLRSLSLPLVVFSRTLQLRPKGAVALAIATQPSWVAAQTGPRGFRRGKAQRTAIHKGAGTFLRLLPAIVELIIRLKIDKLQALFLLVFTLKYGSLYGIDLYLGTIGN